MKFKLGDEVVAVDPQNHRYRGLIGTIVGYRIDHFNYKPLYEIKYRDKACIAHFWESELYLYRSATAPSLETRVEELEKQVAELTAPKVIDTSWYNAYTTHTSVYVHKTLASARKAATGKGLDFLGTLRVDSLLDRDGTMRNKVTLEEDEDANS